jgi:23S rRNA (cytidine2498-2'-O)-methyltransferase
MSVLAPSFLFFVCQAGAETVLKAEMARLAPDHRFAFSRRGFLTFKRPPDQHADELPDLRPVFAHTWGLSLGRVAGDRAESLARQLWDLVGDRPVEHLHVWQRQAAASVRPSATPALSTLADELAAVIASNRPAGLSILDVNQTARPGQRVLDCVLVEPNEWWIGWHRAEAGPLCWPGGVFPLALPDHAVSRAYLKMAEALAWSQLAIAPGERFVEIGSSPGGACQALLDRGLYVTGIDPADMDPAVLQHPRFTHIKKRAADMKRREFADFDWLAADANTPPLVTLHTVEDIVTHASVRVRGILLTLKLGDWTYASHVPQYLARIRSWGFERVEARHLSHGAREVCVAATREIRAPKRPTAKRRLRRPNRKPRRADSPSSPPTTYQSSAPTTNPTANPTINDAGTAIAKVNKT